MFNIKKLNKINVADAKNFFTKNIFAVLSAVVLFVVAVIAFYLLSFLTSSFAKVFFIDEEAIQAQVTNFDLEGYEKIKDKISQ